MSEEAKVPSPCTKICTLDEQGRYCIGCFRTLDEIAQWMRLDAATRLAVLRACEERRRVVRAARPADGP